MRINLGQKFFYFIFQCRKTLFRKKGVLKNYTRFIQKLLRWSLFFDEVAHLRHSGLRLY